MHGLTFIMHASTLYRSLFELLKDMYINNYDTIPLVRCHNLNRIMSGGRSHNDMMKLH